MIVAIDGPSGVGKSTVGRRLASRLGVPYLDTGAMYRAVGLAAKRAGIPLPIPDPERVVRIAEGANVRITGSADDARTFLDGEDVSKEIRTPEISLYASAVSAIPGVRRRLAGMQRELALSGGGVLEGRDIGTKVVPETPHKFFLTARPEVRAERRFRELETKGTPQPFDKVLADMNARDLADSTRADSPLTCDATYTEVDTSLRSIEEV
ncbi:MAG TPA: (d)CMP kinase, partial [Thermoanaerobaculia bacterium]|nr:(d)CMP kinase [Thermoanaerobaculia bacterium]